MIRIMALALVAVSLLGCSPTAMQGAASFINGYERGAGIAPEPEPYTMTCRSHHVLGLGDPVVTTCQ